MGYRLRWPKKNLTHCPGWVDHYKLAFARHLCRSEMPIKHTTHAEVLTSGILKEIELKSLGIWAFLSSPALRIKTIVQGALHGCDQAPHVPAR